MFFITSRKVGVAHFSMLSVSVLLPLKILAQMCERCKVFKALSHRRVQSDVAISILINEIR